MTKSELRAVLPGGVHHEVAKVWAASDDAVLQCAFKGASRWDTVDKSSAIYPFELSVGSGELAWRIKPKTLRYRVALFSGSCFPGGHSFGFAYSGSEAAAMALRAGFSRWVSDWQEVEV